MCMHTFISEVLPKEQMYKDPILNSACKPKVGPEFCVGPNDQT